MLFHVLFSGTSYSTTIWFAVTANYMQEIIWSKQQISSNWDKCSIFILHPQSSGIKAISVPFHCCTWKFTLGLCNLAANDVDGKFRGWIWDLFLATFLQKCLYRTLPWPTIAQDNKDLHPYSWNLYSSSWWWVKDFCNVMVVIAISKFLQRDSFSNSMRLWCCVTSRNGIQN